MKVIKLVATTLGVLYLQNGYSEQKPNVIIILVDDLGYGDLSCQGFSKDIQTPNIDYLLNNGIRFTNFYANCTVSSPSRAALLTGKFPDLVGVPGVIRAESGNNWGYLDEQAVLLPQVLKKQNYHSAIIGKWHLGLKSPNTPNERGFDFFHGYLDGMMDDYYHHVRNGVNYMYLNKKNINTEGLGHATDIFTNWAIDYLNDQVGKQSPFFMYLAYTAPHYPEQPPQEWLEQLKKRQPQMSEKRAKLVALIEHLDYNIGRLYKLLEKNGQLENTLILFASDNGGHSPSEANNSPFRGGKEDMYEGGIHVAGGAYWKKQIQPAVNNNFVMLFDFFPTVCELAGAKVEYPIDAISILPLLKGEKQITDDRIIVWTRREGGAEYGGRDYFACRYKDYKLVQNRPFSQMELFKITDDTQEKNPSTDKNSTEYKQLSSEIKKHLLKSGQVP